MCVYVDGCVHRIIDNMPVTWCYLTQDGSKLCTPGFPVGCYVSNDPRQLKDACVADVSTDFVRPARPRPVSALKFEVFFSYHDAGKVQMDQEGKT